MRKLIAILIFASLILSLSSCAGSREVDESLYVLAIGMDRGVSDKWRLTIYFPTMRSGEASGEGKNGSSGGASGHDQATVDAPSFFGAVDILSAGLPRRIDFTHMESIIISKDLAESGLLGEFLGPIGRFQEIRRSSRVFVVDGTASDFLKESTPIMGSSMSKGLQMIAAPRNDNGYFPSISLQKFYEAVKSPYGQAFTASAAVNDFISFEEAGEPWGSEFKTGGKYYAGQIPRFGKNKIDIFGTAIFDADKMVGKLNGDETRFMLMIQGEFEQGVFTMQDPKKRELIIPLLVETPEKPSIKVKTNGRTPVIEIKVTLDGEIMAVQSMIGYEEPELKTILEEEFKKIVEEGIAEVLNKCQALDADVFYFGGYAARNFLTIEEFESYDWLSHFKDAEFSVEVEFIIRRTGTLIRSYPIKEVRGEKK